MPKTTRKANSSHWASKAGAPGSDFETSVAVLYRELGGSNVRRNVNIHGNEIDVVADLPSPDGTSVCVAVSCKDYAGKVGVDAVREWNRVVGALRGANAVDMGVIVSSRGFTQDAHALAAKLRIKLIEFDALRSAGCDLRPYLELRAEELVRQAAQASKTYVPMRVKLARDGSEHWALDAVHAFLQGPSPMLILLGEFGAGKTTFCEQFFLTQSQAILKGAKSSRIPILVNLRDFPKHLNMSSFLTDLLINQYAARCPNFATIKRMSEDGNLVFIFDAFDEMASRSNYATTLQNFQSLSAFLHGKAKLILTCRTHYFKDQDELYTVSKGTEFYKISQTYNYTIAVLQGFERSQIQAYVKAVCGQDWKRHYQTIENTYNLAELAQRPILLRMITEVLPSLVDEGKEINSTSLYSHYTGLWLSRDDWRTSLSRDERLQFTIALADSMYARNVDEFSWGDVQHAVRKRWPDATGKDLEHYQYDIRICTFIRRNYQTEMYSFVHRSFMEFFVASRLYEMIIAGDASELERRRYSNEVLHFLGGHLGTRQTRETLVAWLTDPSTRSHRVERPEFLTSQSLSILSRLEKSHGDLVVARAALKDIGISEWQGNRLSLDRCPMKNARFASCKWQILEMEQCAIDEVCWEGTEAGSVRFEQCALQDVSFIRAKIDHCTWDRGGCQRLLFEECTLSECSFVGSSVTQCRFLNCNLKTLGFGGCEVRGLSIEGGTLEGDLRLPKDVQDVCLEGVRLSEGGEFLLRAFEGCGDVARRSIIISRCVGLDRKVRLRLRALGATIQ